MFVEFQRTIIGNGHYDPNASRPPFWRTFFYVRPGCGRACIRRMYGRLRTARFLRPADASCTLWATSRAPAPLTHAQLNSEMLRANAGILQRHPWETVWCVGGLSRAAKCAPPNACLV
jgi:hypothetical protein